MSPQCPPDAENIHRDLNLCDTSNPRNVKVLTLIVYVHIELFNDNKKS